MKLIKKKAVVIILFIVFNILFPFNFAEALASMVNINLDGWGNEWQPISTWEYPNSSGKLYKNGKDDIDNKHQMAIFCDGTYVYLYIQVCTKEKSFQGRDFSFFINGEEAVFEIAYAPDGNVIDKNDNKDAGIYPISVRHSRGNIVSDVTAYYNVKPDNINNEIEIKLPIIAMKDQNSNVNLENVNVVEFFCPHLMHRRISWAGVSTAPYIGIALCVVFAGGVIFVNKRKQRSKKA